MYGSFFSLIVSLFLYGCSLYGFGLRLRINTPFILILNPIKILTPIIEAATKSKLRKNESIRDLFVFREGAAPQPEDLTRTQALFILSLSVLFFVHSATILIE